ncbi:MAG: argininosuccinate lyase [Bacteroidales bacterium]|nr:argininosuccinate lyase [Bacteroidales bacterium]
MTLWKEHHSSEEWVENYTTPDKAFDQMMAPFDILGSIAHLTMLRKCHYVSNKEFDTMKGELIKLYRVTMDEGIQIPEGIEDIHSYVELYLTDKLGKMGKRLHTARSRNDQVLLDIKLYIRNEIEEVVEQTGALFQKLMELARQYEHTFMPGYTHGQIAMPSTFGLWFSAYGEQLAEDLIEVHSAFQLANMNPLGSGAGYGTTFDIDRELTTSLLGFDSMHFNVIGAQLARGKTEILMAQALAAISTTLSRLANDCCLFLGQNFKFLSLDHRIATGSSIMPHKKNPDVFELLRANLNRLKAVPGEMYMYTTNLNTGYSRDFQLTKQSLFPAIEVLKENLNTFTRAMGHVRVNEELMEDARYRDVFSVNRIRHYTDQGLPFREAYHKVAAELKEGKNATDHNMASKTIGHIGNMCFEAIENKYDHHRRRFPFNHVRSCMEELIEA